jgi:uncharacterized hydrophobic protein (TIGR00271 family)
VLELRVFAAARDTGALARSLEAFPGVDHVMTLADERASDAMVWAVVDATAADSVLELLEELAIDEDSFTLARVDVIAPQPSRQARPVGAEGLAWVEVLGEARAHARPVARYLVLMGVAGVLAALGVIDRNPILIVGAMAVSPDLLPVCAICVGLVGHRARLVVRAAATLIIGLALVTLVAALLAALLDLTGDLPRDFQIGKGGLGVLASINYDTVLIAMTAGVAAMLTFETRAGTAVGVAISVTTIPASAYLGVALGVGEAEKALGALALLAVNLLALTVSGTATLALQRWARHRRRRGYAAR